MVDRLRHRGNKRGDSIPIINYKPTNSLPGTIIFEGKFTQEGVSVSKKYLPVSSGVAKVNFQCYLTTCFLQSL